MWDPLGSDLGKLIRGLRVLGSRVRFGVWGLGFGFRGEGSGLRILETVQVFEGTDSPIPLTLSTILRNLVFKLQATPRRKIPRLGSVTLASTLGP